MEWQDSWGDPSDFAIDPERTELDGFKVGDRVRVIEDNDGEGYYEGDEGVIVGIAHIERGDHPMSAPTRDEFIVKFDQMDPIGLDPEHVEHE